MSSRIEQGFADRIQMLPAPTRTLLLIAAAEPIGEARLLVRAAEAMDIAPDAAPRQGGRV